MSDDNKYQHCECLCSRCVADRATPKPPSELAQSGWLCDEEPFEAVADGTAWDIDENRSVAIYPGKQPELMLLYVNHGRKTCVRLSKEAAQATIVALARYIAEYPPDQKAHHAA